MAWSDEPPEYRQTAERVCTQAELNALILKSAGYGIKRGSRALGISESTWRYRIRNATRKIIEAINEEAA